jgi:hypothetical protein
MNTLGQTYNAPEEAIAAAKASASEEGMISFDGHNCDDLGRDCMGWDGESHRCDCGNRRVYWDTMQTSDGKFYAYATAY